MQPARLSGAGCHLFCTHQEMDAATADRDNCDHAAVKRTASPDGAGEMETFDFENLVSVGVTFAGPVRSPHAVFEYAHWSQ